MYCAWCWCQEEVGEKAFDSVVYSEYHRTRARLCWFWWAMMKAQVDARKAPLPRLLRTRLLWFPISTGVEVCSLAAGHSGSVLTKLCLFPGLQGSQGKLGSRGETNKKAPLSHTLKLLSNTFVFSTQWGYISVLRRGNGKRKQVFLETGPRDNKTAVVLKLCIPAQFKCHFELLLVVMFFFFLLCVFHLLLSSLDSALFVLGSLYQHILSETQQNCHQQQARSTSYLHLQPQLLTLEMIYIAQMSRSCCNRDTS